MTTAVTLEGVDRLRATLGRAADDLGDLSAAAEDAGRIIVPQARSRAPVLTGRLAAAIAAEAQPDGLVLGAGVPYAGVQEYGWPTRHIPAQPYIAPAVDATQAAWIEAYRVDVQAVVDRVEGV
jgi:hypothetical protein